jgi:hypothetical protein
VGQTRTLHSARGVIFVKRVKSVGLTSSSFTHANVAKIGGLNLRTGIA